MDALSKLENRIKTLYPSVRRHLRIDPSLPPLVPGDRLEERLYRALKTYPSNLGIVIQGACLRIPNTTSRGSHTEHDFLVINPYGNMCSP